MAGTGKRFIFHGAYGTKKKAVENEKKGEFIRKVKIRGRVRYDLLSRKGK